MPIPTSYKSDESICLKQTDKYLSYLNIKGVDTVMTTAGTSQFNLLSNYEIQALNACVDSYDDKSILGVPPLNTCDAAKFARENKISSNSYYMALYPDRFYSKETVVDYFSSIREHTENPLYVHSMFMRGGRGGTWNYTAEVLNDLFEKGIIAGIKEEHTALAESYNVLSQCPNELDIIVAGGSMRRHQFLRSAGANSYLAGIGSLFPSVEIDYNMSEDIDKCLQKETKLFNVFNKHGWHRSLRAGLSELGLCCHFDRSPYPVREDYFLEEIKNIIKELS